MNIHFGEVRKAIAKEIADEVYVRLDPQKRAVVGLTILHFRYLPECRQYRALCRGSEYCQLGGLHNTGQTGGTSDAVTPLKPGRSGSSSVVAVIDNGTVQRSEVRKLVIIR